MLLKSHDLPCGILRIFTNYQRIYMSQDPYLFIGIKIIIISY